MHRQSHIVTFALTVILASPLRSQVARPCRPADHVSSNIIAELKQWVTTTDPERIRDRDSIFKVPVVNPSEIAVAVDDRICKKAIEAYSKLPGGTRPTSLYVIRMGPKYFAVHDPLDKAGDMMTVHIMNRKFISIGGWTGP